MATGVFLCNCRQYLSRRLDLPSLEQQAAATPGVEWVETGDLLCDAAGWGGISRTIQQLSLDSMVLGACCYQEHEGLWNAALAKCGLAPGALAVANLRDSRPEEAGGELARALARVSGSKTWIVSEEVVHSAVCVIGAGLAGLEAALNLAALGLNVSLVEQEMEIGGTLRYLHSLAPEAQDARRVLAAYQQQLATAARIQLYMPARVQEVTGQVGNFELRLEHQGKVLSLETGAIVIATGTSPTWIYPPAWQTSPQILTQFALEQKLREEPPAYLPGTVAFLLDWGGQSSRLATLTAFKQALLVKQLWGSEAWVMGRYFYVDAPAADELYREARQAGVVMAKFDRQPLVHIDNEVGVEFTDLLLGGAEVSLTPNLLVVEDVRKSPVAHMANLRLEIPDNVFYLPVRSSRPGIYVLGSLRGQETRGEIRRAARQAAQEIYNLLGSGKREVPRGRVEIDAAKCAVCLTCIRLCPHQAIELDASRQASYINEEACSACGTCAAECPAKAIQVNGYRDTQVFSELAAGEGFICTAAS